MNGYVIVFAVALATFAYLIGCFRGYGKGLHDHNAIMPHHKLSTAIDRASKFLRSLAPFDTRAESYEIANVLDDVLDVIDPIYNPKMDHPDYRNLRRADEECFNPEFHKK